MLSIAKPKTGKILGYSKINGRPLTSDIKTLLAKQRGRGRVQQSKPILPLAHTYVAQNGKLVVCKLEADGDDYHFAVMPPGFGWFDKPGPSESRYGKLDAYSQKWKIGDHVYDSAPIYFEYIPG